MAAKGTPRVKLDLTPRLCDQTGNTTTRARSFRLKRLFNWDKWSSPTDNSSSLAQDATSSSRKSRWSISDDEPRNTGRDIRLPERRGSMSSEKGPVKCLVVDNDFKAFTTHVDIRDTDASPFPKHGGLPYDEEAGTSRRQSWGTSECSRVGGRCRHWSHFLTSQLLPALKSFVHMPFQDRVQELAYQKEVG